MRSRCRYLECTPGHLSQPRQPHGIAIELGVVWHGHRRLESVCGRTFAETLTNIHLRSCFLMYVDNRLLFSPRQLMQLPCNSLDLMYNCILGPWGEVITCLVKTIFPMLSFIPAPVAVSEALFLTTRFPIYLRLTA